MFTPEDIQLRLKTAFAPDRCDAEVVADDGTVRFRVMAPDGRLLGNAIGLLPSMARDEMRFREYVEFIKTGLLR